MQKERHYVYLTVNKTNGMKYVGRRTCYCEIYDDDYMGSGTFLKQAIEKYGVENFEKIVLCQCETLQECINKEVELIRSFDAVNSKEFYNVSPYGQSRSAGFSMTQEEKKKREYLLSIMDNEIIYGMKMEDEDKRKHNGIPKIVVVKCYKTDRIGNFHTYDANELKNAGEKREKICVISKTTLIRSEPVDWLNSVGYVMIPEETYKKIRIEAADNYSGFKRMSAFVEEEVAKKEAAKKEVKTNNLADIVTPKYKGRRMGVIKALVELSPKSKDCRNVLELLNKYGDVGLVEVFHAVTGSGSVTVDYIRSGNLKCSDSQKKIAAKILEYERKFLDFPVKGRRDYFNIALEFCYTYKGIDNDELYNRVKKRYSKMKQMKSIEQAINQIDAVYNYRCGKKIPIARDYVYAR